MLHDGVLLPVDSRLEQPVHGVDEVVAMELRVKPEDARAEHSLQQLVAPGADPEPLRVGPGDVPEHDHRRPRQALPDQAGGQSEVIVLNEHDRIVGVHLLAEGVGEFLVDGLVVLPIRAPEDRTRMGDVAERPETLVGEAVVVALLLLGREPDPAKDVRLLARGDAQSAVPVRRLAVGGAAPVRHPDSRAGAHDRLERRHEAARRVDDGDAAIRGPLVDVGLPIRDDDDLLAMQIAVERLFEPLGSPVSAFPVGFLLGDDAVDQVANVAEDRLKLRSLRAAPEETAELAAPPAPREARGDDGHGGRGDGEKREGQQQEPLSLRFAPLDEGEVVHQDHEPERLSPIEDRDRADVDVPAGQRDDALPEAPAGRLRIGPGQHVRPERFASELARVILGLRQELEVGRARRGGHDSLVVGDLGEETPQVSPLLPAPVRDQRLARPVHRELGPKL